MKQARCVPDRLRGGYVRSGGGLPGPASRLLLGGRVSVLISNRFCRPVRRKKAICQRRRRILVRRGLRPVAGVMPKRGDASRPQSVKTSSLVKSKSNSRKPALHVKKLAVQELVSPCNFGGSHGFKSCADGRWTGCVTGEAPPQTCTDPCDDACGDYYNASHESCGSSEYPAYPASPNGRTANSSDCAAAYPRSTTYCHGYDADVGYGAKQVCRPSYGPWCADYGFTHCWQLTGERCTVE